MSLTRGNVGRLVALAAVVALAAPAGAVSGAGFAGPGVNPVLHWNAIASNTLVVIPGPAGGAPPALQINMAMVQGAVYDAVNATTPIHHQPYLLDRRFALTASKSAAVARAAYLILSHIVSTVPAGIAFPNRTGLLRSLDTEYATALGAIHDGPFKDQGIAAGTAAAEAMIAARGGDGRFGPSQWVPNDPGHWQPLLNPDGTQMLDPTPWVGGVKPFLLKSPSQFRTAGPPMLTSAAWATDFNEVKALGSLDSTVRTPDQTHIALWWQSVGGPTVLFNAVARDLLNGGGHHMGVADSARLLAMMNLSGADAAINCWNDKYHYDFWRPWQAIREADRDDNPATEVDDSWTALLTAPYPDHPSGHLCLDAALLGSLQLFFGTDNIGFDVTSSRFGGEMRHFDRFSEPIEEIIEARIWAGLHYRTADVQAELLGRNVVSYMEDHYFQPVRPDRREIIDDLRNLLPIDICSLLPAYVCSLLPSPTAR